MKTDTLFDLPPPQETRLEKIKRENGIWTHHAKVPVDPWTAWLLPDISNDAEFMEQVSRYCRMHDESGHIGYGDTEADAVSQLCKQMNIPCVL